MAKSSEKSFGERTRKWILRFIKFNIIVFIVFLVGTGIFALAFPIFGEWALVISSDSGGILRFS